MELGTTTSTAVHDLILSVLIVISDIVFKWLPAAVTVITGQPPTFGSLKTGADLSARLAGDLSGHVTQVALEGTRIDSSGIATAVPIDGSIGVVQATAPVAQVSPLTFAGDTLQTAWHIFAPLSIFISLLLAMGLVYAMVRFFQVRFAEEQALHAMAKPAAHAVTTATGVQLPSGPTDTQKRWARIQEQIASTDENDWRLAILESDIILGDALTTRGYVGESIGEQLKGLTRGDLASLDAAWDAHKVRNHIAHRGTMHDINQREAKRVIAEFGQVFNELGLL